MKYPSQNFLAMKETKPVLLPLHVCWELLPKVHVSCREQYCPPTPGTEAVWGVKWELGQLEVPNFHA